MAMHLPVCFVATTFNVWKDVRWPERKEALESYIKVSSPDILCLQELRLETRNLLDVVLPDHSRVDDGFEGWSNESNIYWNTHLFELVSYGAEQIGILEPLRRLFWVRLKVRGLQRTLMVATAHYSYQGTEREKNEGINPRIEQARKTIDALNKLSFEEETVLFMGDLNDSVNAIRVLKSGGLQDSFSALGSPLVPTHPAIPTSLGTLPQVIDWQFHKGPIRVMNTSVVDYFHGDIAPSDHKPVVTTYVLT